jgi:FkbM family methyltransferase
MRELIINIYAWVFARPFFAKFNKFLFRLSLTGLGILNYKNSKISGEQSFLKNYLNDRKGVVIDVGANEGNYSAEILNFNQSIRVYAFEPHPVTFGRLVEKFKSNKKISVINKGMSSVTGTLQLYDYANKDGSSHASLFSEVITDIHHAVSAVSHTVNLTTLDEFVEEACIDEIILLKIDTEGNELEVLRGADKCLRSKKINAIHLEFNEMNVVSRCFFRDIWKALDGYRIYRMLPNGLLEIERYDSLHCEIFAYQNIVAIAKND